MAHTDERTGFDGVTLGISTASLAKLAGAKGWSHNVPSTSEDVYFCTIIRVSHQPRKLFCTLRFDRLVCIRGTFDPPDPGEIQRLLARFDEQVPIREAGLVCGVTTGGGLVGMGDIDGASLTLVDMLLEGQEESNKILRLLEVARGACATPRVR